MYELNRFVLKSYTIGEDCYVKIQLCSGCFKWEKEAKSMVFDDFCRKNTIFCIFFKDLFGESKKSSTFALAKRNDTVCSLKY